jgi:DNA-binding Xre family transcriptional regulator
MTAMKIELDGVVLGKGMAVRHFDNLTLAERAGVHPDTVRAARAGHAITLASATRICRALANAPIDPILDKLIRTETD